MTATIEGVTTMSWTGEATFIRIAATLQAECTRRGLTVPAFRARPTLQAPRTIRRLPKGVVVSVRLDRDAHTVTGDLIEGCMAANPLVRDDPAVAEMVRAELWEAAGGAVAA